jgi:[mycofactocin precursor peptide]-tyrosine decarboxylase / 3-amino-5-[(4-hydroxyphenyl)methyl]-4,4-dimethylpyrrolidin-2-one synthase
MMHPLVLVPQFFGSLVFDRRTSRYLPFDEESTHVLRRLTRESIDAVLASLPRAEGLLDHLTEAGFFDLDGRLAADVVDVAPPADHLVGPIAVHLEVIAACNLTCRHCFAGDLPRKDDPLRLREIEALLATLARMGSFRLGLTGGEPLMRHDLFDILDAAVAHGLHPCLTTNGLLVTEDIARRFARRDLVWLNVSLDGATAATNDRIRGAGTFERVLARLRVLGRHARFTLAFTITRDSAEEVDACAELARRVGAHAAVFRPLYPVGVARRHPDLMPTYDQYADALQRLSGDLHALDPFSPQSREAHRAHVTLNNGCGAANLVCSISVQGQVNPCSFLGTEHDAGNIRVTPFDEIWHSSAGFTRLRATAGEAFCGGCRARALAFNGSVHAEDPWHRAWQDRGRLHPMSNLEIE